MTRLTLCSDDYGLNTEVNDAILALVLAGRLNAVSCMAVGPTFDGQSLREAVSRSPIPVQIGLHLTLTEYRPLTAMPRFAKGGSFPSVSSLLVRSHLRRINRADVKLEFERQFDVFDSVFGCPPDFADGHQHVHIFPGIREVVFELALARLGGLRSNSGWVRCCDAPTTDLIALRDPRAMLLAAMSRRHRSRRVRAGLLSNKRFYGVNAFDRRQSFRALMRRWLGFVAKGSSPSLIMCHPGLGAPVEGDPIAERRADEFSYLKSDQFIEDLNTFDLSLV